MNSRSSNFSPEELETLVRCMESNPQLAHGKIGGEISTKKLLNAAWEAVATQVNSVALDIHRTSHQMRAKWFDYKYRVRQKAAKAVVRSGSLSDLTPLEWRVLSLIGPGRVKAITDNDFDTGVEEQILPCDIATEASKTDEPAFCAVDRIDGQMSVLIKQEGQTDILTSSEIKKEVDSEILECSNENLDNAAVLQRNENCKIDDVQYTVLIPVQFPMLEQENAQNKSTCIQTTSVLQSVLPQKETGESEKLFIQNGAIIPVQSRLSEQENENEPILIQNGTVIPVQSSLSQQENEKSGKNNIQNSPVIHVLSRPPEPQNVNKEQNANQSIPVLSNESNLPEGVNGKRSESALKITSVISKSSQQEKGKRSGSTLKITSVISKSSQQEKGKSTKSASNHSTRLDLSESQQDSVPSNETSQNWQLAASSPKGSGTVRSQRLRTRKRKLREEEENAVERQVLDTQADMATELKKITSHLATIANTNLEILKYLKNIEKKQETVITYLSVALNLDDV